MHLHNIYMYKYIYIMHVYTYNIMAGTLYVYKFTVV